MPSRLTSDRSGAGTGDPRAFRAADLPVPMHFGPHRVLLRRLEPADLPRLLAFFESHTPETIQQRYGYCFTQLPPETATRLVNVDPARDAALGVFEGEGDAARLIAIGRYCLGSDGQAAEVAFVVHEQRRDLGIGTTLLEALTAIARERGLDRLVAQVQWDNAPMLAIFRRAGASVSSIAGTSALKVVLPLRAPGRHRRTGAADPHSHATAEWLHHVSARAKLEFERASMYFPPNFPTP